MPAAIKSTIDIATCATTSPVAANRALTDRQPRLGILQHGYQLNVQALPRRRQAEHERAPDRCQQAEDEDTMIELRGNYHRKVRRNLKLQERKSGIGKSDADSAPHERQGQAFRQQLPKQPPPADA